MSPLLPIVIALLLCWGGTAEAAPPDLTAAGVIATIDKSSTYNLGPTGLRGWVWRDPNDMGNDGLQTAQDRQILVTVVGSGTPADGVLAVNDVILGVKAGSGTVPAFTSDCRKAFGWAIGDAETAANAGILNLLRWRAGVTTTVSITLPTNVRGTYTDTAPYNCPKSTLIRTNARNLLVNQLLADSNFLGNNYGGAIKGLALMAGVAPGDPNYAAVQTRLQALAHTMAPSNLGLSGCDTWNWGYKNIFLSEYYLRSSADGTPDTSVLHGINEYTVGLARSQSKYGTFGHGGAEAHADGSLHGSISWYGPVNSAGIPANLAILLGKKALLAGTQPLDPEINPAIERGSNFFGWYVNKGAIPYGEHEPYGNGHASNGKDAMCAVFFGLQDNRPLEAEYFARMAIAGCTGREYGHTGQGFSYLWGAMGAHMGGQTALAEYLKTIRWHLDLERRTDGSFVYDGGEQYGGGATADGTYLGASSYYDVSPTATYLLTYSLPLQRLYITGREANPAHVLNATKVANAIAASTFKLDCKNTSVYPTTSLIASLSEYDPAVRSNAATELATRTLTSTEVTTLITLAEGSDANARMGACEALGALKRTRALPALGRLLSDPDPWVRGKAANALKNYGTAASPQLTPMLTAFVANATDPDVIVWDDPIQIANGYLADTLFQTMADNTITADRQTLLYPAVRAGLKQPDGLAREYLGDFIQNRLTWTDVQAVAQGIVTAATERSPANRMFSDQIRDYALNTLAKFKIEEGIPLCLMVKEQEWHSDNWTPFNLLQNTYRGAAKAALPTLYKWQAHLPQFAADSSTNTGTRLADITSHLASTIAAIENDTAPPMLVNFKNLTPSASPATVILPTTRTVLTPGLSDIDGGTPNFIWSMVRGPGPVTFAPSGITANPNCAATFQAPGTYVLRVTVVDRTILDYNTWITYCLGYYDFHTYNEILGAVTQDLTVTVAPDPNRAPVPQNQSATTAVSTTIPITLAATDPDGDPMSYWVVTQPAHGTLTGTAPALLYTPAGGYAGPDSFTFKANDGKLDSPAATVTIDVGMTGNCRPVALNQWVTTAEDTAHGITLTGTDPDSDSLTYEIVSGPLRGALTGTAPNLTYQPAVNYPAGNFAGSDSFTFTVRDASLTSAPATVSITVTPVNDPPQALAQSVSVSNNTAKPITLAGLDPEGYALTYAVVANPAHGDLTGNAPDLIYQPAVDYRGADSFTFKVIDSEGVESSAAMVSITILNDPPVANPQSVELQPNTSMDLTLTGSDNANDTLTYTVLNGPVHGVLSGTAPNLTYTPAAGYTGGDSFTFKVNDGLIDSPAATVTLNVLQWQMWTNIAGGAWSTGSNWTNNAAPGAGGSSTGFLVFNTAPYSGASSNDLAGSFQLSRMEFGVALPVMTLGGNTLAFTVNSGSLPHVNQNSPNAVTVSNKLTLTAGLTIGGTGAGELKLAGVISGAGGLTKTSLGALTLSGAHTYDGGTVITKGDFRVTATPATTLGSGTVTMSGGTTFKNLADPTYAFNNTLNLTDGYVNFQYPFGGASDISLNGPITGNGGLELTSDANGRGMTIKGNNTFTGGVIFRGDGPSRLYIQHVNALGTGTFRSEKTQAGVGTLEASANLSTSPGVANAFDIAAAAYLNVKADGSNHLLLSGPLTGAGSLYKTGTATLTLAGVNTYSGTTTVAAGILACSSPSALAQGPLAISSGAKLALNFSGTRYVTALSFAGTAQSNGTYSSATSPTYISGTGTLTIAPATSTALDLTGGSIPCSVGDPLTFTATVTGNTPTGNVAFYAGTTLLGTSALNDAAQASVTTSSLAAGSYNIIARYAGDADDQPSSSAAITILVAAVTIDYAPVAGAQDLTTKEDTAKAITLAATDADGDPLTYAIVTQPAHGALSGTAPNINYTPEANYYGPDSFTFRANDGFVDSAAATVSLTVTPVNDAPVAFAQNASITINTSKAITLSGSDVDGDALTYRIAGPAAHGSLSGTAPNMTYTPAANYSGPDSFSFKANDGKLDSAVAVVSLMVGALPPTLVSFTQPGTTSWTAPAGVTSIQLLVVGGGGGGGNSASDPGAGGGGGAGGLIYYGSETPAVTNSYAVTPGQTYTVTVGAGGTAHTNGQNSSFNTITAVGGGSGGQRWGEAGGAGGSGGGAAIGAWYGIANGATCAPGQGNVGGGSSVTNGQNKATGGGGGGAGTAGATGTPTQAGKGGDGLTYSITGTAVTYAGGGGGSEIEASLNGVGGAGYLNPGGGGMSTFPYVAAAGGGQNGIVIVSYTVVPPASPFSNWIDGMASVPAGQTGFGDDPNKDGVANGLAWILLGGAPMGDSRASLPVATQSTGKVILEFTCLKPGELGAATFEVQYGNDLGTWQAAVVPGSNTTVNNVVFTVTSHDETHNHVKAEIPQSAAAGGKLFSRLHATLP